MGKSRFRINYRVMNPEDARTTLSRLLLLLTLADYITLITASNMSIMMSYA